MTKEKTNRRGWVKNFAIVFLAVMLVLTFFSNTIMNHSLPVVSAQYPGGGTINAKIRGTGTISSNENYNVTVDETREVKTVAVKTGDTVTAGQVLFILADRESDELQTAKDTLTTANYDYQEFLLDISASDANVISAQQALTKAKAARDKAYKDYSEASGDLTKAKKALDTAQAAYDAAKAKVDAAQTVLDAAQKVSDSAQLASDKASATLEQLTENLTDEQTLLKQPLEEATTALNNAKLELESAEDEKEYLETELGMTYAEAKAAAATNLTTMESLSDQIYDAENDISSLEYNISKKQSARNTAMDLFISIMWDIDDVSDLLDDLSALETSLITAIKNNQATAGISSEIDNKVSEINIIFSDESLYTPTDESDEYVSEISELTSAVATATASLETYCDNLEELNDKYETAEDAYDEADAVLSNKSMKSAMADYEEATELVKECQEDVNEETIKYNNLVVTTTPEIAAAKKAATEATNALTQAKYELTSAQSDYDLASKKLTDPQSDLETAKTEYEKAKTAAEADLTEYDTAVSDAQTALSTAVESSDITDGKNNLELQKKKEAVTAAQAAVDKLTAEAAPLEVAAKADGVVTEVNVAAGDKTDPANPLAAIELSGKGYTLTLSVTAQQATKVTVGDQAELTDYWYSDYKITLVGINPDRESKGQKKILTFSVEGDDVVPGQSMSISIGQKSESYDTIIPSSAVREDTDGKYIYVVESKSSPLGNRYVAKRLDVAVLSNDDTNSAVSGLDGSEFIIVSSTAPLESNMQVRLSEE